MMTKLIRFFLYLYCFVFLSPLPARELPQRLARTMELKGLNNYFEGVMPFLDDAANAPNTLMDLLSPYKKDSSAAVRGFYIELYAVLYENGAQETKRTAVTRLCEMLSDSVRYVRSAAAVVLESVAVNEFTAADRQLIVDSFTAYGDMDEEQLLVAGYLKLEALTAHLQQVKNDPAHDGRMRWCATLALARMDNEEALDFILSVVRQQAVNDRVVYRYFPDLIYTRQRKAFDYLVKELFNNNKNCHSPNPDVSTEMVCGYRIMEMLAPVIKNYPLAVTASGSILTKSYDSALETVRKWFTKQADTYEIISDTF